MDKLIRRIQLAGATDENAKQLLRKEWLVSNGLGGYASGTISGSVTRRYHGLLIAALPSPLGRVVMLNHLAEYIRFSDGKVIQFGGGEQFSRDELEKPAHHVVEFRLENQLPVWKYEIEGITLEKRLVLIYGQNTVHVTYTLLSDNECVDLEIRPSMHFRPHEYPVTKPAQEDYMLCIRGQRYEVNPGNDEPGLHMTIRGQAWSFTHHGGNQTEILYELEAERGYESKGTLWSPGYFTIRLNHSKEATLIASTEPWSTIMALRPDEAWTFEHLRRQRLIGASHPMAQVRPAAEMVLAADQFIITPAGRVQDAARARASGDEVRTVIAGYHWFTDWGRDTMISLEGLTLTTGRYNEAGWILRTFAHYIKDGLIPNMFPEGENEGLYHTADATLWFFHALDRYLDVTNDRATLMLVLPKLIQIAEKHLNGTHFSIGVDQKDGLLKQGQEGYQLTWMDAKVDGWVVTPRRGKAVEINALWYNALCLLENWLREVQDDERAAIYSQQAKRCYESFNNRFWYEKGGHLYDIIDGENGNDHSCRPNQVLAISLKHPVLDPKWWKPVMDVVNKRLVTPVGLRSLAPGEPDYKPKYFGDLRTRDAAYHQGTVWGWLIGPYIDAWLKVCPEDRAGARKLLEGFIPHLDDACIGTISEIFDAESPFTPRGCIAQAWSVAEFLRCWVKTGEEA